MPYESFLLGVGVVFNLLISYRFKHFSGAVSFCRHALLIIFGRFFCMMRFLFRGPTARVYILFVYLQLEASCDI